MRNLKVFLLVSCSLLVFNVFAVDSIDLGVKKFNSIDESQFCQNREIGKGHINEQEDVSKLSTVIKD